MQAFSVICNLPWTFVGLMMTVLSVPMKVRLHRHPFAIVLSVKSFWYRSWYPKAKGTRGCVQGHIVLLGPKVLKNDFEHELVHIEQINRAPFIHPFLYAFESLRHGYRNNKYEREAYDRAGNPFLDN